VLAVPDQAELIRGREVRMAGGRQLPGPADRVALRPGVLRSRTNGPNPPRWPSR